MRRKIYDSDPIKFSLDRIDYLYGKNEFPDVVDRVNRPITLKEAITLFKDPRVKINRYGTPESFIAQHKLRLPVNIENVKKHGICVVGQTGDLAPADKKLYALRDVTATVDSMPLIASSIMGKKLAADDDCIVLDVKTGSGAFMKTYDDARRLAETMVKIGNGAGRKTYGVISDMNQPLGYAVGNILEVKEAIKKMIEFLEEKGIATRVVSMPCQELFEEQSLNYQMEVLGTAPVISVEAGSTYGWNRYAQKTIRIDCFGASAPASKLYEHFGLTPSHITEEVEGFLSQC